VQPRPSCSNVIGERVSHPYNPQQPTYGDPRDAKAQAKAEKAYRKAQRPWYKKKRYVLPLGLVVLIVLISALSGGGGSGGPSATSGSSGGSTPAAQDPKAPPAFPGATEDDTVAQAGAPVDKDSLVLTSTAVKAGDSTFGKTLCTTVSYNNGTDKSVSFNGFDWKLQDPNGTILSMTIGGSSKTLNSGDLAPGGKVSGDVCFENKGAAAGQYVVLYQGNIFLGDRIAWINNR
jgi:hypothetical protein